MHVDLERWVQDYTTYLLKISYLYVKDRQAAEDIVQDVFMKLYHSEQEYVEQGFEKNYLVTLTINRCKDYLKSWHYRKMQVKDMLGLERGYSQKDALVTAEENAEIGLAVLALPLKYREIIILYYFEEQTVYQIADTLMLPLGTVKTRLIKARNLLKEQLQQSEWEVLGDEA